MKHFDLVIVGGGIAGCCAAYYAAQRGKSILWFDQAKKNVSSSVAAGMVNPIVLRRFTKSWMADTLLPHARSFYHNFDDLTSQKSFYEIPIYRVFASKEEKALWHKKMAKEGFSEYMAIPEDSPKEPNIHDQHGYGLIKGGGYLNVNNFMPLMKAYIQDATQCQVETTLFQHEALQPENKTYKDVYHFDHLLFCEGQQVYTNPFFNHLPYGRTKGEVLHFKTNEINIQDGILSRGIFCLPLGKGEYKIGATFTHDDYSTIPTEKGKEELLSKLQKLYKGSFELTQHYAGIRPTVKDRRPLLGQHPKHDNLFIFNGLGAKGVLLAPYFANAIINLIFDHILPDKAVDISRFNLS